MFKGYGLSFLLFITTALFAQKNGSVKGIAFDTIIKQPVAGATITLLERKDSSLVSFTLTGSDGRFELKGLANGTYRLLITHVNYYNSNTYFTISDKNKNTDQGNVVMNDKVKVLEEVVLASEEPPVPGNTSTFLKTNCIARESWSIKF